MGGSVFCAGQCALLILSGIKDGVRAVLSASHTHQAERAFPEVCGERLRAAITGEHGISLRGPKGILRVTFGQLARRAINPHRAERGYALPLVAAGDTFAAALPMWLT